MNGRAAATARAKSMGVASETVLQQLCGIDSCTERRVTTFSAEDLCCDHFLGKCYEFLGKIDPERDLSQNGAQSQRDLKVQIDECAQRVLEVSLGTPNLSNTQRARLLDILLWTSDICTPKMPREIGPDGYFSARQGKDEVNSTGAEKKWTSGAGIRTSLLF
jgi:hypothetical protein